jgi:hypothetical protein
MGPRNAARGEHKHERAADPFEIQALLADAEEGTVLQHVFIDRSSGYYVVKSKSGQEVLRLKVEDIRRTGSPAQRIIELLHTLVCSDCGEVLYAGEEGVCGPCEGRQLRELIELRGQLRDELT